MGTQRQNLGANDGGPPLMDIEKVASRLGVTVRHVRRLVSERRIPYLKWGHLVRFDPIEIAAWLDAARQPLVPDSTALHAARRPRHHQFPTPPAGVRRRR